MINRSAIGRAAGSLFPGLHEYAFNRDRDRTVPGSAVRVSPEDVPEFRERPFHIVVAALEGPGCDSWGPAQGNYYYEVFQSACEKFGSDSVSVLDMGADGSVDWGHRLSALLQETQATHLVAHMERDPGMRVQWTWDVVWSRIAQWWDGVFVGVMWDSGFDLVRMKGRRLARISPNLVGLDICVPIDSALVRGRVEVGPVPLLESQQTMQLLSERLSGVEKSSDLSFIGALYPYRIALLEELERNGIRVAVNPHKSARAPGLTDDRPSWLDYMAGLAASEMTLNFSMASSGAHQQLKWRVIEATLAGTLLLTDDEERSAEFFEPGREFDLFQDGDDLRRVIDSWLSRPEELHRAQERGKERAKQLADTAFWDRLRTTLERRGLPPLPTGHLE